MDAGVWAWMAIWVLALFGMVWLIVWDGRKTDLQTPAEILRRRFAAGEISEEEFRHASEVLGTGEAQ